MQFVENMYKYTSSGWAKSASAHFIHNYYCKKGAGKQHKETSPTQIFLPVSLLSKHKLKKKRYNGYNMMECMEQYFISNNNKPE